MENKICEICHGSFSVSDLITNEQLRLSVRNEISRQSPSWREDSFICETCLDKVRIQLLQDMIEEEKGELSALDEKVIESLTQHEIVTQHTEEAFAESLTFGQQLSDKMANFGGSWRFLILFSLFMVGWITVNRSG